VAQIPRTLHPERRVSLVTALLLVFLTTLGMAEMAVTVSASQGQNQDIAFSVNGRITEQSAGKLTVDSGQNMLFTVKYDSSTKIRHKDGSPGKASELRIGTKIRAKGVLTEAGDVIAKTITIESSSKAPAG